MSEEIVNPRFSTRNAILLTAFSALGTMNFGVALGSINTTSAIYRQLFEWCGNDYEYNCDAAKDKWSYVNSIIFLSAAIASQFGGGLLKYGRRTVFLIMDLAFIIGPIFGIISPNDPTWSFVFMLICRFITGIGLGLSVIVCSLFVAESVPHEIRGTCGFFLQILPPFAGLVNMGLGLPQTQPDKVNPLPPGDFERWWWQFVLALPMLFAAAQILFLFTVYKYEPAQVTIATLDRESAMLPVEQCPVQQAALKHIKLVYHPEDAMMVLEDLKGARLENLDKEEAKRLPEDGGSPVAASKSKFRFLTLLEIIKDPTHLYVLLMGVLLGCSRQLGMINVFSTKSNMLLEQAGVATDKVTLVSFLTSAFSFLVASCMAPNANKFGRRSLILFANAATALLFAPTAVLYWFEGSVGETTTSYFAIATMVLSTAVFQSCLGPTMWVYIAEMHHPATKNASVGFINMFNWAMTLVVVFGSSYVSVPVVYNIGFFSCTILALLTYLYLKETAGLGGRSPYYPDLLVSSSKSAILAKKIGGLKQDNEEDDDEESAATLAGDASALSLATGGTPLPLDSAERDESTSASLAKEVVAAVRTQNA